MAQYDDGTLFHLTRSGWVTGNRPADAAESWRRWSFRQSGWPNENVGWTSTWADRRISRPDRNDLRKKFPELMGVPGRSGDVFTTIGDPI